MSVFFFLIAIGLFAKFSARHSVYSILFSVIDCGFGLYVIKNPFSDAIASHFVIRACRFLNGGSACLETVAIILVSNQFFELGHFSAIYENSLEWLMCEHCMIITSKNMDIRQRKWIISWLMQRNAVSKSDMLLHDKW